MISLSHQTKVGQNVQYFNIQAYGNNQFFKVILSLAR